MTRSSDSTLYNWTGKNFPIHRYSFVHGSGCPGAPTLSLYNWWTTDLTTISLTFACHLGLLAIQTTRLLRRQNFQLVFQISPTSAVIVQSLELAGQYLVVRKDAARVPSSSMLNWFWWFHVKRDVLMPGVGKWRKVYLVIWICDGLYFSIESEVSKW